PTAALKDSPKYQSFIISQNTLKLYSDVKYAPPPKSDTTSPYHTANQTAAHQIRAVGRYCQRESPRPSGRQPVLHHFTIAYSAIPATRSTPLLQSLTIYLVCCVQQRRFCNHNYLALISSLYHS
ncbi:unnamed protein product, partial [Callosobruchus maculatus]